VGYNPSYKWINPTYPIYNWGYNPLTKWDYPPSSENHDFMGKSTISTGPVSIAMLVYQRVDILLFDGFHKRGYPNSWMFYFMENHKKNMDDLRRLSLF